MAASPRFAADRKRRSRLLEILTLAHEGTLPPPKPLRQIADTTVCEGLFHVSTELRVRVAAEARQEEPPIPSLLPKFVELLGKPMTEPHLRLASGYDSLARLNCKDEFAKLPATTMASFLNCCCEHMVTCNEATVQAILSAVKALQLVDTLAIRLVEVIEASAKSKRVEPQLAALHALDPHQPEIAIRIIDVLPHLSSTSLTDLQTKETQMSCLEAAQTLLLAMPPATFNDEVAAKLEQTVRDPQAYSTRHHAATQRDKIVAVALRVLLDKYAPLVKEHQLATEERMRTLSEHAEAGDDSFFETLEQDQHSNAYGKIISTVQDCLGDRSLAVRAIATKFVRTVSGPLLAKVLTQQLLMWLSSGSATDSNYALSDLVGLVLDHDHRVLDPLLEMLEDSQPRVRQAAVTCLHNLLQQPQPGDMSSSPFAEAFDSMKAHVEELFAEIMLQTMCAPTLSLFSRQQEDASVRSGTFKLLRLTQTFDHEGVCNAILALQDEEEEAVQLEAGNFIAVTCFLCKTDDRKPAISAMAGVFSARNQGWPLKLSMLATLHELGDSLSEPLSTDTAAFDALVSLFFDPDAATRARASAVTARLVEEETRVRLKLSASIKNHLVNAGDTAEVVLAIQAAATIGCRDAVLIELMSILTSRESPELRIAVFDAWLTLGCLHKRLVAVARDFLHSSHLGLRDSARTFVFQACMAIMESDSKFVDDNIVHAAIGCLTQEHEPRTTLTAARAAAVRLLKCHAAVLVSEMDGEEDGDALDKFDLKSCLRLYLSQFSSFDSNEIQTLAWAFFTDFFPFEEADLPLFAEAFHKAERVRLRQGATAQNVVVQVMCRLVLRTAEDVTHVLQAMINDAAFCHLYFECVLRYAQSKPKAEPPAAWPRLHGQLTNKVPVEASMLAAEFIRASEDCEPLPEPEQGLEGALAETEEDTSPPEFHAETEDVSEKAVARTRRQLPTPTGAGMRALKQTKAKQQETEHDLQRRLAITERAAAQAKEELVEVKRALSVAQKALKDEQRTCKLLQEQLKRQGARPSAAAAAAVASAPAQKSVPAGARGPSGKSLPKPPQAALAALSPQLQSETESSESGSDTSSEHDDEVHSGEPPPGLAPPGLSKVPPGLSPPGLGAASGRSTGNSAKQLPAKRLVADPRKTYASTTLQKEQSFAEHLRLLIEVVGRPLLEFERQQEQTEGVFVIAAALQGLLPVVALQLKLVTALEQVCVADQPFKSQVFVNAYQSLGPSLSAYSRYQLLALRAKQRLDGFRLGPQQDKFSQIEARVVAEANSKLGTFDPQKVPSTSEWFLYPGGWPLKAKECLEGLLNVTKDPNDLQELSAAISVIQEGIEDVKKSRKALPQAEENAAEFQRFCHKKFKGICPDLFSPTRILLGRWAFRQVKSKRESFLQRRESDTPSWPEFQGKSRKAAWSALKGSDFKGGLTRTESAKGGSEMKVYLFNDSILCAAKKLNKPQLKFFVLLHNLEVLHTPSAPDVFGLKVRTPSGESNCVILKASTKQEQDAFLAAVAQESMLHGLAVSVA